MTKSETAYASKIRAHLEKSFPNGAPHTLNVTTDDWVKTISNECPPPKAIKDPGKCIMDAVADWLGDQGYSATGVMWVHEGKRDAARQAEAQAQADKAAQETAPLRAIIREEVTAILIAAGLAKPAGVQPSNVLEMPRGNHSRKKGPGRGH